MFKIGLQLYLFPLFSPHCCCLSSHMDQSSTEWKQSMRDLLVSLIILVTKEVVQQGYDWNFVDNLVYAMIRSKGMPNL